MEPQPPRPGTATAAAAGRARRVAGLAVARASPRERFASGSARVRASWWGVVQSAVGGTVAWQLAERLLGHRAPFFASVAAIVCLSTSYTQRLRRVVEMGVGVSLGVLLGDLLVRVIGHGSWQLGFVVLVAMSAALLLNGGAIIVNQAALQAVFVLALPPPSGGHMGRWEDALVGGAVALAVAFAAPPDARPPMRDAVNDLVGTLARALRTGAAAARDGDAEAAQQALEVARSTDDDLDDWQSAVRTAEEVRLLSPLRRPAAREAAAHRRALEPMDRAVRNLRVALRRLVVVTQAGDARPGGPDAHLPELLEDFAGLLFTVPGALRDAGGEGGRRLRAALDAVAGRLDPGAVTDGGLSATVVVAQLRSAAVDLYELVDVGPGEARRHLP